MKYFIPFIVVFLGTIFYFDSQKTDLVDTMFTEEQQEVLNGIIYYYDAYVLSQVGEDMEIDKAYKIILDSNAKYALKYGAIDYMIPGEYPEMMDFIFSYDTNVLKELFRIYDSTGYYDYTSIKREKHTIYYPWINVDNQGALYKYFEILAPTDSIYLECYQGLSCAGDFKTPTATSEILLNFKRLNFKSKDARLVYALYAFTSTPSLNIYPDDYFD